MSRVVPMIRLLSVGTQAQKAVFVPEGERRAERRWRTTTAREKVDSSSRQRRTRDKQQGGGRLNFNHSLAAAVYCAKRPC